MGKIKMADDSKVEENKISQNVKEISVQKQFDDIPWSPPVPRETTKEKFLRKTKENPLVPIGAALTVTALTFGLINFKRGDSMKQQLFMRARVVAQGFTVLAIVGGLVATMNSKSPDNTSEKPSQ